jgi:hypothetical protein
LSKIQCFDPLSRTVTIIQIIDSINIVMVFFIYSWYIFYDFNDQDFLMTFMILSMLIFLTSTFFKLNTGYFEGADLIQDKALIYKMYKERYLFSDILAQFSLTYNIANSEATILVKLLSVPIFAKTKSLLENISILEDKL